MSNFDKINQNVFGLVALVVSLVALVTTVLQVLQQYYSSAEGYRRCAPSVMGLVRSLFLPLSNFAFQTPKAFCGYPRSRTFSLRYSINSLSMDC